MISSDPLLSGVHPLGRAPLRPLASLREINREAIDINAAARRLEGIVVKTPLQRNDRLSRLYSAEVYLKREDLQPVRSYKLRGAYNLMCTLDDATKAQGVVCASAGNHAQGFAYSCQQLGIKGTVFMPVITPRQKIGQTKMWGGDRVEIVLHGDNYDECAAAAKAYAAERNATLIPAFDHPLIIEGQGTVGKEILDSLESHPDYLFLPVGGGGLAAGVGVHFRRHSPDTIIIGAEPAGAPSMTEALAAGAPVTLSSIEPFVDGAAVKRVGEITHSYCREVLSEMTTVDEGLICSVILSLYNRDAIVAEPAGALSIAALEQYKEAIRGKTVVCVVSGSNNDIDRMPEIQERALQYLGLKHYLLVTFPQRPGALRQFVSEMLGPTDDIVRFEYMKKTNKEAGPALIGIEVQQREDYTAFIYRLQEAKFGFRELNKSDELFGYLV